MKIGKPFNKLTSKEYFFYIDNYKKYTDFNTLGLYRSIIENNKLTIEQKIEVRKYAHKTFKKSFDFLQLKDPKTFFDITTLGQELTEGDIRKFWEDIRHNQQKILSSKRLKHRNFGDYSKHNCGYETCPANGLMIRQGSFIAEVHMWFDSDKNKLTAKAKSDKRKTERKRGKQIINKLLEEK